MRSARRSYRQYCGAAYALDLLGERWTLLLLRDLLLAPRRYGELLSALPGITTNLLAARLEQLVEAGLVAHVDVDGQPRYAVTELGRSVEPVIVELGRFGARLMGPPRRSDTVDVGWAMFSLKRRYRPPALEGLLVQIVVEPARGRRVRRFELCGAGARLEVLERDSPHAALVVEADAPALFALLSPAGGARPDALRQGGVQVRGSGDVEGSWQRFLRAFGLSDPERKLSSSSA